jgi:hypothetical protein
MLGCYCKLIFLFYLKLLLIIDTITNLINLSPRRFELLQIPHQEIILPLNYRLSIRYQRLALASQLGYYLVISEYSLADLTRNSLALDKAIGKAKAITTNNKS